MLKAWQNRPGNAAAAFWGVVTTRSLHTFAGWRPPPQQSYWRGNAPTSATPAHTLAFWFQLTQNVFAVWCGTEFTGLNSAKRETDDPSQSLTGSSHGWSTILSLQQWFMDKFESPPSMSHCSAQCCPSCNTWDWYTGLNITCCYLNLTAVSKGSFHAKTNLRYKLNPTAITACNSAVTFHIAIHIAFLKNKNKKIHLFHPSCYWMEAGKKYLPRAVGPNRK